MSLKIRLLETALLFACLIGLASWADAVAPGTAEANSALSFDPFNPDAKAAAEKITASGVNVRTSTTVAGAGRIAVASTVSEARTPINPPRIYASVSDAPTVVQSTTQTETAVFIVRLSIGSPFVIKIAYQTIDGPRSADGAQAGEDYTKTDGTLTFAPWETSLKVNVPVLPERNEDVREYFNLSISEVPGTSAAIVQIARKVGICYIQPPVVGVSISNAPVVVQNTLARETSTFTVALSSPATTPVTVHYATVNGTAIATRDYLSDSGILTFEPGVQDLEISVTILPENVIRNSIFHVILSDPLGAPGVRLLNAEGSGVIRGHNSEIFLAGATVSRPLSGTSIADVRVYLDKPSTQTISVTLKTVDATAHAKVDYDAVDIVVTFAPGQISKSVAIPILAIKGAVPARGFDVLLIGPVKGNGWIEAATAVVKINGQN